MTLEPFLKQQITALKAAGTKKPRSDQDRKTDNQEAKQQLREVRKPASTERRDRRTAGNNQMMAQVQSHRATKPQKPQA